MSHSTSARLVLGIKKPRSSSCCSTCEARKILRWACVRGCVALQHHRASWECDARLNLAARTTVRDGLDQRLEALSRLIAAPKNGDVDQRHKEADEGPDVRDYGHGVTSCDESRT